MSLQGKIYTKFVMALNKLVRENLKPDLEYNNINEIDLEEIKRLKSEYGIGGMIIDVDGTILHELEFVPPSVIKTLKLLNRELKIYLVSNNKNDRIEKFAKKIGINYMPLAFKPRRKPFIKASSEMGLDPENIIVIGDGFLTDILGGQRMGMFTGAVKDVDTNITKVNIRHKNNEKNIDSKEDNSIEERKKKNILIK